MNSIPKTLEWVGETDGFLRILDQTRLPSDIVYRECRAVEDVWEAIRSLRVRGAPAIGVAAAYGVVLGVQGSQLGEVWSRVNHVCEYLANSRPTAVNLFWALNRMRAIGDSFRDTPKSTVDRSMPSQARNDGAIREMPRSPIDQSDAEPAKNTLLNEAKSIEKEGREMCCAIGQHGAELVPEGGVLTHCNAGALATAGGGLALSLLYEAHARGKQFRVYADETRPLLQGSRLTAWELLQAGIDVTLLCDNMAASLMASGVVQMVLVGADRIAANGDTANKIGTYGVALLANAHSIPFYVAAPSSTFDLTITSGDQIPIEQRNPEEVTHGFGSATAPAGVHVYNPAFDVTPAHLIAGIVTEKGVVRPVNEATVRRTLLGAST
jgi:methylthioribose-1-phosphate isomerase